MKYWAQCYQSWNDFNRAAEQLYKQVMDARSATSYDAFWRVEHVVELQGGVMFVVWAQPAPLRKH